MHNNTRETHIHPTEVDRPQPFIPQAWGPAPRDLRLFGALDPAALDELKEAGDWVSLRRSQVLHDHGHVIHWIYLVVSGLVSAVVHDIKAGPVEVMTSGAGEIVGLPTCLGITRSPHRTVVLIPGEALRISATAFQELAARHRSLNEVLMNALGALVVQQSHLIACNARHSIRQRLARWLLTASDQLQLKTVEVTHSVVAQAIGVRRAGITTELGSLQAAGLVDCARGRLKINDREQLEDIACNCYQLMRAGRSPSIKCTA